MPNDLSTPRSASTSDDRDADSEVDDAAAVGRWGGTALVVNGHRIPLAESTDLQALMAELTQAVTGGARFVHLDGLWGHTYDVMVTPSTHVLLSHAPRAFDVGVFDDPWTDMFDLDISSP